MTTTELPPHADVVIVGGGPAGLGAATRLRRLGVGSVVVLEREPAAGGIPRHCGHYPFGAREFRRVLKGPDYARNLVETATAAGVAVHTGVSVMALNPGPELALATASGRTEISAKRVLLATGVRETSRSARNVGGTKPAGVMTTGTLQAMVYLQALRPFRRPVIIGTELVSFSAIATCRHLGIRPVAMIGENIRTTARWPTGLYPRMTGIPLHLGAELLAINGREKVENVLIKDAHGIRKIDCDGVILSGKFRPDAPLVRDSHLCRDRASGGPEIDQFGRCSDPDFFAAGNLLRPVETAGWSWQEGHDIAQIIAQSLGKGLPDAAAVKVAVTGDAIAYCVPQKLATAGDVPPLRGLQLRVSRPVQGQLVLRANGQEVTRKPIRALPERRIILPYPDLSALHDIEVTLEETPS